MRSEDSVLKIVESLIAVATDAAEIIKRSQTIIAKVDRALVEMKRAVDHSAYSPLPLPLFAAGDLAFLEAVDGTMLEVEVVDPEDKWIRVCKSGELFCFTGEVLYVRREDEKAQAGGRPQ